MRTGGSGRTKFSDLAVSTANGDCPFTNCIVTVPQDQFYAIEKFGRYTGTADPGFNFTGCDINGCCINYRVLSKRVHEAESSVPTRTMTMITSVNVTVQHTVDPNRLTEAFYKLEDFPRTLNSVIKDAVQTHWPKYPQYDVMAATEEHITKELAKFGVLVNKVIASYVVPTEIAEAQEMKQRYERDKAAIIHSSEADKATTVKQAEANAEKMALKGQGLARERAAIVEGLKESIHLASGDTLTAGQVTQLVVITEHYDTLRGMATDKSNVVFDFVPPSKASPLEAAFLQAPPQPQSMAPAAPAAPAAQSSAAPAAASSGVFGFFSSS